MPSREELEARAGGVNIDVTLTKYKNDSVLEQAIINAETSTTATSTATTKAATPIAKRLHGGKNV